MMKNTNAPLPADDWISQVGLAEILGISTNTASIWAQQGRLKAFEHGVEGCGRRKYSRAVVKNVLNRHWESSLDRINQLGNE